MAQKICQPKLARNSITPTALIAMPVVCTLQYYLLRNVYYWVKKELFLPCYYQVASSQKEVLTLRHGMMIRAITDVRPPAYTVEGFGNTTLAQ